MQSSFEMRLLAQSSNMQDHVIVHDADTEDLMHDRMFVLKQTWVSQLRYQGICELVYKAVRIAAV